MVANNSMLNKQKLVTFLFQVVLLVQLYVYTVPALKLATTTDSQLEKSWKVMRCPEALSHLKL